MAELMAHLSPYNLEATLDADRADNNDCFVLDVGRDDKGNPVASLEWVIEKVDDYTLNVHDLDVPTKKLYIVGDWVLAQVDKEQAASEESEDQGRYKNEPHKHTAPEQEWHEAGVQITKLVAQMPMLKELTWISELPFMTCIWEKLPTSLTKLVLDLGQPVRLQKDRDLVHKSYVTPSEMKPLQLQTELKELRLFRMYDSLQSIVWETVYRNASDGGVRVLDLNMAAAPLVRSEHWRKANDVVGLTVPNEDSHEKEYKGIDGKGILHYAVGTGEYLDDLCMRKARIASGMDEAKPLPLWCLKLDGFVIDHLPFEHELSRIVLLTCGENCVDAGLRAPKTRRAPHNKWSRAVNNAASHCLIQWPNWTGIFDDRGDQRNTHGDVVSQEAGLSTLVAKQTPSPGMPLTEESLQMKELDDALDGVAKDVSYFVPSGIALSSAVAQTPMGEVSNASTRGSDVHTPTIPSKVPTLDGAIAYAAEASTDHTLTLVTSFSSSNDTESLPNEAVSPNSPTNDADSPTSTTSSFEQVNSPTVDNVSADNEVAKAAGFKHKVRRSLGWQTGFSWS